MNRRLTILCICILGFLCLYAQEVVTGVVVDSKKQPIPGVRVEAVDHTDFTTTDIDGRFRMELPATVKKLKFSYIGQKPVERKVKPEMLITMGHGWQGRDSGYRGFWTFLGGFGSGGTMNFYMPGWSWTEVGKNSAMFGFSTTHGYQIMPMLYAGVGAGINALWFYALEQDSDNYGWGEFDLYGFAAQFYADVRWDLNIKAKTTPYVDLKLGYQRVFATGDMDPYNWHDYNWTEIESHHTKGFFLMPTVGLRIAIGSKRAINMGLSYNVFVKKAFTINSSSSIHLPDGSNISNGIDGRKAESTGGCALFNFGFDF